MRRASARSRSTTFASFMRSTIDRTARSSPSPATSIGSGCANTSSDCSATGRTTTMQRPPPSNGHVLANHIPFESTQSHVGIAYPTIPYKHPDYFQAWAAVGVLVERLELAAVHRSSRAARSVLHRERVAPHAARSGGRVLLRRHDGRAGARNARRDDRRVAIGLARASRRTSSTGSRPASRAR